MEETFSITIKCPSCKKNFSKHVNKKDVGKLLRCKCTHCGQPIRAKIPSITEKTFVDEHLGATQLKLLLSTNNQEFQISEESTIVGRKPTKSEKVADVEVETSDMTMSRCHAIIRKVKNIGFTIRNPENKTNGISINGGPKLDDCTEIYLNDGDTIRMGNTELHASIIRYALNEDDVTPA